MPPFGSTPSSRSCGLRKKTVSLVPSARFSLVEPRPRSHRAIWLSSYTIVLPRGLTCANPLGSTLPTRHTFAGKAVSMCGCRILGIVVTAFSLQRGSNGVLNLAAFEARAGKAPEVFDQLRNIRLQALKAGTLFEGLLVHVERAVDFDLQAVSMHPWASLPLDDLDTLVDFVDP